MTKNFKIPKHLKLFAAITVVIFIISSAYTPAKETRLKITFLNTANGNPIVLRDSAYQNSFGETYTISKLKYYISNIRLDDEELVSEQENYQLIDLGKEQTSFTISVKNKKFKDISFLVGIDSARNCSGAQEGALDPMNDMFWTWNTGYVMFKLEGTSPSSTSVKRRIEHHVGGYRFGNNVATRISLSLPSELKFKNNENEIIIKMDLDKYWKGKNEISIAKDPVCTLPGTLAKYIAGNFTGMFSLHNITVQDK